MGKSDIKWGRVDDKSLIVNLNENKDLVIDKDGGTVNIKIVENSIEIYNHRFIVQESDSLYIKPSFPNLPVIIRCKSNLSILPKKKLSAFVQVPLYLSIYSGNKNSKDLLYEMPLTKLSKSYLGDPETGEISYSLESDLFYNYTEYNVNNRSVYCKISITNKTSTVMNFERMILRVPNFNIYEGEGIYFSNPQAINYIGRDVSNQMTIKKLPPNTGFPLKLVGEARESIDSSLLRKSFYFIKNIYNT
ncbi:DUF432 domain-containing protein [Thiospirochaeta perfilievii]|uniref:DUF432 domain-containing protein n=1 Tax=Thiospirochaeta perfilievii TaxID=252967 RepID=UPI0016595750|nr:DUF432 domain-containing protein [Thiospirochaeta perfilievii]